MIALNSAVAYQLTKFKSEVDQIIKKGRNKDEAIFQVLKKYILDSERVLFEGDNYSTEWHAEAAKRKLCNISSVPDSLKCYLNDVSKEVLTSTGVFTEKELRSRVDVEYDKFTKIVQIEARVLGDLAINHIVPTAIKYMTTLIENVKGLKDVFSEEEYEKLSCPRKQNIRLLADHINEIQQLVRDMIEARKKANVIEDAYRKAITYEKNVKPYLNSIRRHIDKLELIVDDEIWPLPKYRELLFTR
jgi:glutamine synthetase